MLARPDDSEDLEAALSINNGDLEPTPEEAEQEEAPHPYDTHLTWGRRALFILPIATATIAAMQMAMQLDDANKTQAEAVIVSFITFLSTLGINRRFNDDNLEEIEELLRYLKRPEGWPELSKAREYVVLAIGCFIAGYMAFCQGTQDYQFMDEFPDANDFTDQINLAVWQALAVTAATMAAAGAAINQGFCGYKLLRGIAGGKVLEFENLKAKYIGLSLGIPFGFFCGLQTYFSFSQSIPEYYSITMQSLRCTLGVANIANILGNIGTDSIFRMESIDRLFTYLKDKRPSPADVLSFAIAATAAGTGAYYYQPSNYASFADTFSEYGITAPNILHVLSLTSSLGATAGGWLIDTATLVQPIHAGFEFLFNCCQRKKETSPDNPTAIERPPENPPAIETPPTIETPTENPVATDSADPDELRPLLSDQDERFLRSFSVFHHSPKNDPALKIKPDAKVCTI